MTTAPLPYVAGARRRGVASAGVRIALHGGAMAAAAAALTWRAETAPLVDADLARLLRMMALLKAGLLLGGLFALDWRLRRPAPPAFVAAYLGLAWLAAAGVATIWRLTALAPATLALHAAGAALIVLACLDREFIPRPTR